MRPNWYGGADTRHQKLYTRNQVAGIVEQMENTRYQIEHTRVAGWVRQLGGGGMVGHSLALHGAAHIYHTPLTASPCHHYLIITLPNLH